MHWTQRKLQKCLSSCPLCYGAEEYIPVCSAQPNMQHTTGCTYLIVGVQAMGHVCRHQKTSPNCSLKKPLNINNIQDTMHLSSTKSVSATGRYCNYKSVWCVLNPFGTSSQYDRYIQKWQTFEIEVQMWLTTDGSWSQRQKTLLRNTPCHLKSHSVLWSEG
jgi:hypothetical protein